ncbi:MAG: glutathione S-transferase N-terminal domain-containing protein [Novosphingobium sp.]|jgi:GST-like protein|nr:glutathione S-transferase N-terminal domain-containing protein [Novosphingobium sp.]
MIDLYYAPTPNTWKASIMLEECGLPYRVIPVDILAGDQKKPDFLAINPNGRIPAIVDHNTPEGPLAVFESGAILIYLAEKTGRFLAPSGRARFDALGWLMWQMGGLGPIAGQAHHFRRYAPAGNDYSADRFVTETTRLYGVLDERLRTNEWLAGADYSIADMACWGWVWYHRMHGQNLDDFPAVARWFPAMAERPAVQRGRLLGIEDQPEEIRVRTQGPYYGANGPAPGAD